MQSGFETSVFVNCPFDEDYYDLLRPLLFTILYLGFTPRIASEVTDSGQPRISKIISIIKQCQYGIHDLSRIRATKRNEVFRLNMPFELGLDYACKEYKTGKCRQKRCLILGAENYQYQAAISDLSNSDIFVHQNKPERIVAQVRNWFAQYKVRKLPGGTKIWYEYADFNSWLYDELTEQNYTKLDIKELPIIEVIAYMKEWITANKQ